ncbi:DUF835 domain-containing protein [Pyrococcus yayanosii]|uniref:DUF835 domain-containing protein n=1 Tax=Pyrococcus yayanosii (strain CH1 / JCM 16557) TaxID=529709 RepID=F8AGK0_PYRYC|nr:DUF835 domain-containing protein [Pyrococcus yayanosii]AEH23971.1 hypothetical protein PYCH_02720 [Pyrococcus yayanosii CH1]
MPLAEYVDLLMLIVSLLTSAYLFTAYLKASKEYTLFGAFGWAMLAFHEAMRLFNGLEFLQEGLLYGFSLGTSLYILSIVEELSPTAIRLFKLFLLIPLVHIVYRLLWVIMGIKYPGVGGIAGDSGTILLISAYVVWRVLGREGRLMALSAVPLSVALLLYKICHSTYVELVLVAIGAVMLSWVTVRTSSRVLFRPGSEGSADLPKGLLMLPEREFRVMLKDLEDNSLLLFTREVRDYPESWTVFYVTNAPTANSVRPTSLEKMTHLAVRYLREAREMGTRGIVALDCLEYLRMYNDFSSLLKFLHNLRDYAIVEVGTALVSFVPEAWDERERALLMGVS